MSDRVFGKTDNNFVDNTNVKTVEALDDVFDEMDNIEETAAKVLYGLQNMDRTESPQSFSVPMTQSVKEIGSEFLTYTNYVTRKEGLVSVVTSIGFTDRFDHRFYISRMIKNRQINQILRLTTTQPPE